MRKCALNNVSRPFVEYREEGQYGTSLRNPTREELAEAEALKSEIAAASKAYEEAKANLRRLAAGCKHVVSQDTAGFPYDLRRCYTCGANLGVV